MIIIIFFITGLLVGSFLNVVVCRLRWTEDFLWGRSKCPHCKNLIRWYDNLPLISFVILNCKCRDCRKKISWQYPLVEFFTALLFVAVGVKFFNPLDSVTWIQTLSVLGIISFLIIIFLYDLLYMEVPGAVLWVAIGFVVAGNLAVDWNMRGKIISDIFSLATYSGVFAAVVAFALFFALVLVSREKWMGMGDAYIAILLGLFLGWPKILLSLTLSFGLGAVVGLILIGLKLKNMKSQVPFAPFLVTGALISFFFYKQITDWYFSLLTL